MNNPKNTSESIRQRIRAKKLNESTGIDKAKFDSLVDQLVNPGSPAGSMGAMFQTKIKHSINGGESNDEAIKKLCPRFFKSDSPLLKQLLSINESEDDEYPAIFKMQTSGGKYGLEVYQSEIDKKDDKYSYREFTSGKSAGGGSGFTKEQLTKRLNDMIKDSREIDGISYKVTDNKIGLELNESATDTATGTVDKVLAYLDGKGGNKIDGVLVDSSTAGIIRSVYTALKDPDLKLKCQNMPYPKLANACWKIASKNGVSWKSEGITEGKALIPGQLYVCESILGKSLGKYLNPKPTILGTYHMFESLNSSRSLVFMESELSQVQPLIVESVDFDEMAKLFEDSGKFKYTFPVNQRDWDAWKEKQKENYTFSKLDGVDAVYNDGDHIMSFNPNKKEVYADIPKFLDKEGKLDESANGPTTMSTDGIIGMFMPSTPRWNILNDENTTSAQLVSATGSNYDVTRTGFGDKATYTITPATNTNEASEYSTVTWDEFCDKYGINDDLYYKIQNLAHDAEEKKYSDEEFAKEVATMVTNKAKLKEVLKFWLSGSEDFNGIVKAVGINEDKYDDITDQLVEGVQFEDVEGATYTVISRSGDNITFRSDKDDDHNIWNGEKTTNINGPNSTSLFCKILSSPANEAMVIVDDKGTKGFEDQSELEAYLDKKYGSNGCARTPEDKDTIYARTSDWKEVARWKGDDDYGVLSESVAEGDEPEDTDAIQKELNDLMMATAGKSNESDEEDEDELHQDPMSVAQIIAFHKKKTGKDLTRASLPDGKALAKFIYDNFREIMHKTDYDDELAANRMADILSFFHMDETEFMRAWNKLIK